MKLDELNTTVIPNEIVIRNNYIITGGFVFNTGSKDIFLSPNDIILKMGRHEIYEREFTNPLTYIGFVYYDLHEPKKSILLLFEDIDTREKTRITTIRHFKTFVYNSPKSVYSINADTGEIENIYMNHISFFGDNDKEPVKQIKKEYSEAIQQSLFG